MDKPIKVALIDDEQACIDNLSHYVQRLCPRLRIDGTASNASAALDLLNRVDLDVAFLDIHLFDQNIFDFLPRLSRQDLPLVFVSAHSNYAMQAFRVSVLDYLLKPLDREELGRCYDKIVRRADERKPAAVGGAGTAAAWISLRQGDHVYQVAPEDILLLRARGFYTEVSFLHQCRLKSVVISKPLNTMAASLAHLAAFQRVHRSYVINSARVVAVRHQGRSTFVEMEQLGKVPVAKRRAGDFLNPGCA